MQDVESLITGLRGLPMTQGTRVLALECTWDNLFAEIDTLLKSLGFKYFTYGVMPRSHMHEVSGNGHDIVPVDEKVSGSLPDDLYREYLQSAALTDPLWEQLIVTDDPLIIAPSDSLTQAQHFWSEQGVKTRIYIPLSGPYQRFWFHYFGLYFEGTVESFEATYGSLSDWLIPVLERYHRLLQAVSEQPQNPLLENHILSKTCVHILHMTAQGMPVKRIADKLSLTEEGVTYHITRAKKRLRAKNKTQLIALLYESGLLK